MWTGPLAVVFKFTRFVRAFARLRVDGKRDRQNIYAVLNLHGYVWKGPDKALGVILPSVPLSLQITGENLHRAIAVNEYTVDITVKESWKM